MSENLETRLPQTGETRKWNGSVLGFGTVSKYSLVGFLSEENRDTEYVRADWDSICGASNPNGYGSMDQYGYMIKTHKTTKERDQSKRDYIANRMPNDWC